MFEWLGERARARAGTRACAANAVRVPAGVCDLVADSGVLLVIGFSNLISSCGSNANGTSQTKVNNNR